jgi:hypothetical protein
MTKTLQKALGKYLEEGLQNHKSILEKYEKAAIVIKPARNGEPEMSKEELINQRKATISLYEQLLQEYEAGNFSSDAMRMAIQIIEEREREKLKVKQNKASRAFEKAILSPLMPKLKGEGYQARSTAKSNELYYEVAATNRPSLATLRECRKVLHIWNDNYNRTKNHKLEMPLAEYMKLTGITTPSKARDRIERVNDTLMSIRFLYRDEIPKYIRNTITNLFQAIQTFERIPEEGDKTEGEEREFKALWNGKIILIGTEVLGGLYSQGMVIPLLKGNLAINSTKFPYAYNFYVRICEHNAWNSTKKNANKISVKCLLDSEPKFPTYLYVKTKLNRDYKRYIIEPFEENMNAIKGISWQYDRPVETYADFAAAHILFEILDNE